MDDITERAEEMADAFLLTRPEPPASCPKELAELLRQKDDELTAGFEKTAQLEDGDEDGIRRGWYVEVIEEWLKRS